MHRERRLTSQVLIFDAILPPSIAKFREFRRVMLEGNSDRSLVVPTAFEEFPVVIDEI
jgi:hypothetical protein